MLHFNNCVNDEKENFLYTGTLALGMFMSGCSDSFLDMNNYGAYDDFNSETKSPGIWPDYIRQVLKLYISDVAVFGIVYFLCAGF